MTLPADAPEYLSVLFMLFTLAGTWLQNRPQRQALERQGAAIEQVRDQVQNTHTTNLREDLDEIHKDVRGIRRDVGDLRSEVRSIRSDQRDLEERVHN